MNTRILAMLLIVFLFPAAFAASPSSDVQATGSYPVVDTGQTKCYNASSEIPCPAAGAAFYGQDAQFTGHAPSYTLSATGVTVSDNVTGLTWERSPDTTGDGILNKADKLIYTSALAHCAAHSAANYQGYNDWRLPSIKELYSLINFNGVDPSGYSGADTSGLTPFIDTNYFQFAYGQTSDGERIIDSQYASSTLYVDGSKLFGVNFADGRIKGYGLTTPDGSTKTFFVQCVRGNTGYGVNAFADNGDQTISDSATGLMWTKADSGVGFNWQEALDWVQTKNSANYLGHNDWRLPNAKELQSILDYSRSPATTNSAAIASIFNATAITNEGGQTDWPWYWASTTHAASNGMGAAGVYLAFGRAGGWQKLTPSATCYTLEDVHGAGAQRSDPKTNSRLATIGTACNGGAVYGLGPQGDVQRASNYVRLVRDGSGSSLGVPVVTASDGSYLDKVVLTWPAISGATSYIAYRSESLAGAKTPANGFATADLSGADLWAVPGITYYYWVKACAGSLCGDFSAAETGWRGLTPPSVTASDGTDASKVNVSWSASSGAISYLAYRSDSPTGVKFPPNGYLTTNLSGADIWAAPGATYYYWVKACNTGNCSDFSASDTGWR